MQQDSNQKISFYLPDFYHRRQTNLLLFRLIQEYPEYFYENIDIGAVYGCFPGSIWNGGRIEHGFCYRSEVESIIDEFNEYGIPVRYTFTNPLIREEHLSDTFCNLCMELGDNGMNEVLVNSPVLEKYIRQHYPDYKILSSTTKCLEEPQQVARELEKNYALVVLDVSFNNKEKIWKLPQKERYEILVDSFCRDSCPNRKAHYEAVAKAQIGYSRTEFSECPYIKREFYKVQKNKMFISVEDLYGKYYESGFRNFKLDGRAFNKYKVIESYVYYLVRPEYRDMIRESLLKATDKFNE